MPENQNCFEKAIEKASKIPNTDKDCADNETSIRCIDKTLEENENTGNENEDKNLNQILAGHNNPENKSEENNDVDDTVTKRKAFVKSLDEIEEIHSSTTSNSNAKPTILSTPTKAEITTLVYTDIVTSSERFIAATREKAQISESSGTTTFAGHMETTTVQTTIVTTSSPTTIATTNFHLSTTNDQHNAATPLFSSSATTQRATSFQPSSVVVVTTKAAETSTTLAKNGLSSSTMIQAQSTIASTTVPINASALPKDDKLDYVLLNFVTTGTEDIQALLAPKLPQSTKSIKVANVFNEDSVGVWVISDNDYKYKLTGANVNESLPREISLTNSTKIFLQNSIKSGLAQLSLETLSQWKRANTVLTKIVYPKSSTDEMILKLKITEMTINIDDTPRWINITDLVDLKFSDNFLNFRQDVDDFFDKLTNVEDRQMKQKEFRLKMSQLGNSLGICILAITNPLIVGSVEAENLENGTKTSISLKSSGKLCVWQKQYRIAFRFNNGSSGTQLIYVIPWTGDISSEAPPDGKDLLLTISVYSQKLKEATVPAQTDLNASTVTTLTVPYNLTDTAIVNKTVFDVGTLVAQFYTVSSLGKNVSLGMAVLSAGKGNYGQWQYFVKNNWINFPINLQHDVDIFKTDVRTRSNGKYSSFNFTEFKDASFAEGLLLDGNVKVRFMPSNEKSFWSKVDAVIDTAFAFLAWNPPSGFNSHDNSGSIQLDIPLCSKCSTLQISKQGVVLYAERYGCDNVLSSMKITDDCNVCGGTNQCYDCKNVPHGKSKWICGICTDSGDSLKDCRGVCNGSAQIFPDGRCIDPNSDSKGCDGDYISLSYTNECNFCVGGLTNRSATYGKDQCGVCNGSNLCLGCDGIANSGKVLDLCKRCLSPSDKTFNKGCGVKFGTISNYILNNTNQTVTLEVSGISDTSEVVCVLDPAEESKKNFSLITSKPQRKNPNTDDYVFAIYYLYGVPGQYTLICNIDGSTVQFNQTVYIIDYSAYQIDSAYPATIKLDDSAVDRKVKLSGNFLSNLAKDPFCLDGNIVLPASVYPVISYSSTEVLCDLSKILKSTLLDLRVIPRNEMLIFTVEKQTPISIKVMSKTPVMNRAYFDVTLSDFTVYFDVNIDGHTQMCDKIFDQTVYAKLGEYPYCTFSANELRVTLGQKSLITINDKITLKPNVIKQANVDYPSYFQSEYNVLLAEPIQKPIPQLQLDQTHKATQCASSVTVAVTKVQGDGGRRMTYKWSLLSVQTLDSNTTKHIEDKLNKLLKAQNGSQIDVPIFKSENTVDFDLELMGCNFLNYCSPSMKTRVTVDAKEETLKISILGLEPPIRSSEKLKLSAVASLVYCNNEEPLEENVKYYWDVVQNDSQMSVLPKYGKHFVIPKWTFFPDHPVNVVVQAAYLNPHLQKNITATLSMLLNFEADQLWIRLEPSTRKHGVNQNLILDASLSVDPNRKDNNVMMLQHSWTCLKVGQDSDVNQQVRMPCYINNNGTAVLLEQLLNTDQPKLIINAKTLLPGIYNFTDTVRSGSLVQDKTVTVTILSDNYIGVEQMPLSEKKPNTENSLRLQWTVPAIPNSTVKVDFVQLEGYGKCKVPRNMLFKTNQMIPMNVPANSTYMVSVTLPAKRSTYYDDWQGLDENTRYKIRLTMNSSDRFGESEYDFYTNKAPSMGIFELIPNNTLIKAMDTLVTLNAASGWTDNQEDLPLQYSFGIRTHLADKTVKDLWFPVSTSDKMVVQFPSALNSHPICNRIGYQVMVKVCDYHGACTTKIIPEGPFQVQVPENLTSSVEFILDEVEKASVSGQLLLAYQKILLLLSELCENLPPNVMNSILNVGLDIMANLDQNMEKEEILSYLDETISLIVRPSLLGNQNFYNQFLSLTKNVGTNFGLLPRQIKNLMRKKRSVDIGSNEKNIDSSSGSQLLSAYELILKYSMDLKTVTMYLEAAESMSVQLCAGRDPTMEPAFVQAANVQNPVGSIKVSSILNNPASGSQLIMGPNTLDKTPVQVEFSKQFQTKYQAWSCNKKTTLCNDICLVTAQYETSLKFTPLTAYFYTNIVSTSTWIWNILSKVYYIDMADPFTGDPFLMNKNDSFSIWIPSNLSSTDLYQCKIFGNNTWLSTACTTNQIVVNGSQVYVNCSCNRLGYVSVFEAPLPPLQGISVHQGANISFTVNNSTFNSKTLQTLANAVDVSPLRFVDFHLFSITSSLYTVWFVCKPPQAFDSEDSSYIVYKLNQILKDRSKLSTFYIVPNSSISLIVSPISIVLNLDSDPRNVTITFINGYDTLNNKTVSSALLTTLKNQVIESLEIKSYRILFENVLSGVDTRTSFNFIIQTPTSNKEISAEIAANQLRDLFYYGDRVFSDTSGASLTIDIDGFNVVRIDKLAAPEEPYDPVPMIVGSVIGSIFFIVIVIVIILVMVKQKNRVEKISPDNSPPHSGSLTNSSRSSAQTVLLNRRVSVVDDPRSVPTSRRYQ